MGSLSKTGRSIVFDEESHGQAFRRRKGPRREPEAVKEAPRPSRDFGFKPPARGDFGLSSRQKEALKRLETRRRGEVPRAHGCWWVVDQEVETFLKREALHGV